MMLTRPIRSLAPWLAAAVLALAPCVHAQTQTPPGVQPGAGAALERLSAWERQDRGVAAPQGLHEGPLHGPTPTRLPGGQVITTQGLMALLQQAGLPVFVFDVLGSAAALPNAIPAAWAAQGGSFDDGTQQQMAQMLRQVTRGQSNAPLVFYCQGPECWMSYNAAARAVRLGYRNVLWYRGGLEAWQGAGLPLARAGATAQPVGARPPGALPPDAFGPGAAGR